MFENLLQILGLSGFSLKGFGPLLLSGTWMTVKLSVLSLLLSALLGLIGASSKLSRSCALRVAEAFKLGNLLRSQQLFMVNELASKHHTVTIARHNDQ